MENKIKIIKLESNDTNKSNLYKDILSSSKKVKDIIKKTKANRNKYRRQKDVQFDDSQPIKESQPIKKTKYNKSKFFKYEKKENCIKTKKNIHVSTNKSKKIATDLFKKSNSILKYFDNKKKQTIKIFTTKQIDKFINVLNYYAEYEQYKNINKYIKKLNKYQTIQILFKLKLIAKKSNAPISLLKSILFTYFYSSIIIS